MWQKRSKGIDPKKANTSTENLTKGSEHVGIKRIVDTSFWTDGKVDEFTPEDKYFMLYLLTNPFSRQLGIYEISIKQAAFQLGYSMEAVRALIERFESKYDIIAFSPETNEIAIKNFLRHSVMKGGKPVEDCIKQDIERVKDKRLIGTVFSHLCGKEGLNVTVKKIVDSYVNDNDIYNDNDNDNDRTDDESSTNRPRIVNKPAVKHKYGEYKNILLTDEELEKLKAEYPDYAERIERLSSYVASVGKSYKSHYATIRNWARKDQAQPARTVYQKQTKADELNEAYKMMADWAEGG